MQNEVLEAFGVKPAELGENITMVGVDLLALGKGTRIRFLPVQGGKDGERDDEGHEHPTVRITGLRNLCPQIEKFRNGLQEKFIVRDEDRKIVARKACVMSIVEVGGIIKAGMQLIIEEPSQFEPLECV
jgi:hypothetical protein